MLLGSGIQGTRFPPKMRPAKEPVSTLQRRCGDRGEDASPGDCFFRCGSLGRSMHRCTDVLHRAGWLENNSRGDWIFNGNETSRGVCRRQIITVFNQIRLETYKPREGSGTGVTRDTAGGGSGHSVSSRHCCAIAYKPHNTPRGMLPSSQLGLTHLFLCKTPYSTRLLSRLHL